jgi:hypothetical protein
MKARHWIVGIPLLAVVAALFWAVTLPRQHNVPLYSAATVVAGLRAHPDRWYGRTIAVRGIARGSVVDQGVLKEILLEPFPANMDPPSSVGPVPASTQPLTILVDAPPPNPLLSFVQRIPLLSGFVAEKQVELDANGVGIYRISIADASAAPSCVLRPCYVATSLDRVSGLPVAGTGE